MAYIGNTNTTQAFTPAIDYFSGNGSTVAFTLSRPVASAAQVQVVVNNVTQNPGTAFTVFNNTITFTGAPSSGSNNIYVYYTSPVTQVIAPSQGTVGALALDIASGSGVGAMQMPVGTTAQRPAAPANGEIRMNTTTGEPEWYSSNASTWLAFYQGNAYSIEYIIVAGGGGGGSGNTGVGAQPNGAGGGGGGVVAGTLSVTPATAYSLVIGGGGAISGNGTNSTGFTFTAGGGLKQSGLTGGASGTPQSYAGGGSVIYGGGGGGGAGAIGGNASGTTTGGNGGVGYLASSFTGFGQSGYFGGGGGGGNAGVGGTGGGATSTSGIATPNTGGGGAGGYGAPGGGTAGGSGVVVIRYAGAQRGTGGTVSSSGGYTYHLFTTSGTFTS